MSFISIIRRLVPFGPAEAKLPGSRAPYVGYVAALNARTVLGWAIDEERPGESLEIEITLGDNYLVTVKADEFSPGLQQHGIGPHAFTFHYPEEAGADEVLRARIKGTDFELVGSPLRSKREFIRTVAGDIVNQCNLRCPFCIVDYTNVSKLQLMTRETFESYLELLPVTELGGFWLSCLHEPTMHPQFVDFIEAAPNAYRDRISFTTNLARRLSTEMLERLANSGVHQIRISFDSQNPGVFAGLRKKAKYEIFEDNLRRLTAALETSRWRPQLHFITMAFKDNYREITDLVHVGRELGADSHEIRYAYYLPQIAQWGKEHFLNSVEWAELTGLLEPVASPALTVCGPIEDPLAQCEAEAGLAEYEPPEHAFGDKIDPAVLATQEPVMVGRRLPNEALSLRLRSDGLMASTRLADDDFCVNINKLDDPAEYFRALRLAAHAAAVERAAQ